MFIIYCDWIFLPSVYHFSWLDWLLNVYHPLWMDFLPCVYHIYWLNWLLYVYYLLWLIGSHTRYLSYQMLWLVTLCLSFQLTGVVTDGGGLSSTIGITINVIRNSDCPTFTSSLMRNYVVNESTIIANIIKLEDFVEDNDPTVCIKWLKLKEQTRTILSPFFFFFQRKATFTQRFNSFIF